MENVEKDMLGMRVDKKKEIDRLHESISTSLVENQEVLTSARRDLDGVLSEKMNHVNQECGELRETVEKEVEKGESR